MCWVALAVVPWRGTRDLCFDEISLFETLPPSQSLSNIGLPLKRNMMWKMAIGWWRLIQKKHEQWSIWRLVRWRETLIAVSSATWWILGGKRSTGNARHVIYDGSVTPRVMLLGWRIPCDNENNFFWGQEEDSQKWNKCSMVWNLIQLVNIFRNQICRFISLRKSVVTCTFNFLYKRMWSSTQIHPVDSLNQPVWTNNQQINFSSECTLLMLINPIFAMNMPFLWVA